MKHNIHVFENATKTAQAVADLICKGALENQKLNKFYNIAVSGGTTPRELFSIMADDYKNLIPWGTLRIFWVDERCVEPTDAESNYGMTYDALLSQPFVVSDNVYRMRGEDDPTEEAMRYEKLLKNELPMSADFPVFDLMLLGMGNDGHTASIFPNNLALLDSELVVTVAVHPDSQQKRITLTGKVLNNAKQVAFIVVGASKSSIIAEIITDATQAKLYPTSYIHASNGSVDFYLDKSASSELNI